MATVDIMWAYVDNGMWRINGEYSRDNSSISRVDWGFRWYCHEISEKYGTIMRHMRQAPMNFRKGQIGAKRATGREMKEG